MSRIFLISDMHFGHKNIINYENRPFTDVAEMTKVISHNWNNVITNNDSVFVLGDVSFMGKEPTTKIIQNLKGHKHLVLGNHDRTKSITFWKSCGFNEVSKYPICIENFIWLSHEPMYMNENMPYINIHGHIHSSSMNHRNLDVSPKNINVCVEMINYTPIMLDTLLKNIEP